MFEGVFWEGEEDEFDNTRLNSLPTKSLLYGYNWL
jgi:hypothetical protein